MTSLTLTNSKDQFGSSTFKNCKQERNGRGFYFKQVERLFESIPKLTLLVCVPVQVIHERLSHTGIYLQSKPLEYLR